MPNVTVAATRANTCDSKALAYACVCENGLSPNVTEYSQTLPYFVCTEWGTQCVAACGQDSTCATDCRVKHQCGAQSPTRVNTTKSSASQAATSADNGVVYTGLSSTAQGVEPSEGGASSNLLYLGQGYGGFILVSALVGGLAVLL